MVPVVVGHIAVVLPDSQSEPYQIAHVKSEEQGETKRFTIDIPLSPLQSRKMSAIKKS